MTSGTSTTPERSGNEAVGDTSGDPMPGRSLGRNVSMLLASQVVTWSISLVLIVMLPRFLGPTAIGQYRIGEAIWSIAGVLSGFGTQTVVALAIARDRVAGPSLIGPVVLLRSLLYMVVAAGATTIVVAGYGLGFGYVFVFLGIAMLFHSIGSVAAAAMQGFEDLTLPARADIAYKLSNAIAVVVALLLGANVAVVAVIAAAAAAVQAALLYRFLRRYTRVRWSADLRQALAAGRRGLPFFLGGVTLVLYHQIDTVVMAVLLEEEQVGWYAAADRLVASTLFIPTVLMTALFPVLARLHAESATSAANVLQDAFRTLLLFSLPVGVGTVILSAPLTRLLFGEAFDPAGPVLAVFGIVVMVMFLTILLGQFAVATGRERFYFGLLGLATIATVPLDLVLVPWTDRSFDNGAIGGALAYVVTEATILVVAVAVLAPHLAGRPTLHRLGRCAAGTVVMAAAVWPIRSLFPVVPVAVGAITYAAVLAALRTFDSREIELARRVLERLVRTRP